jgi:DNA-binding transcriptional LysR family regulator
MNLNLIRSFAVLGEVRHFGEASRRLKISQPSLTKQIRRLEDLLGAALFKRGRQGTELTAFGRQFLDEVQPVLVHADVVWRKGMQAAQGERGRLAIGFTFSSMDVLAEYVLSFQNYYPEVDLTLEDVSSKSQMQRLSEGTLDLAFVRLPAGEGLPSYSVAKDRLAFVFPTAMADRIEDFDSETVRSLPFLGLQLRLAPGLEGYIQRLFDSRGYQPKVMHRVNESLTQLSLIASGLSSHTAGPWPQPTKYHPRRNGTDPRPRLDASARRPFCESTRRACVRTRLSLPAE